MDFEAIRVDGFPIDAELTDTGNVGPDLSAAAHAYLATPRALVWRNPSPDWIIGQKPSLPSTDIISAGSPENPSIH